MTQSETAELTLAMVQSGSVADLSDIPGAKSGMRNTPATWPEHAALAKICTVNARVANVMPADKHSTGGVGDKISLVVRRSYYWS
jgi:thymidine phosphorylase